MTAHGERPVHMPDSALQAEYVFVKRGKPGNLEKQFDGPFKVEERVGGTCLKIRVRCQQHSNWGSARAVCQQPVGTVGFLVEESEAKPASMDDFSSRVVRNTTKHEELFA